MKSAQAKKIQKSADQVTIDAFWERNDASHCMQATVQQAGSRSPPLFFLCSDFRRKPPDEAELSNQWCSFGDFSASFEQSSFLMRNFFVFVNARKIHGYHATFLPSPMHKIDYQGPNIWSTFVWVFFTCQNSHLEFACVCHRLRTK